MKRLEDIQDALYQAAKTDRKSENAGQDLCKIAGVKVIHPL